MAIRNLRYDGDEILRKKSKEVEKIDEKILTLLDDMIDTMHKNEGIGLAAPQVGILKRAIVVDIEDGNTYKMLNPKIIKHSGKQVAQEGCLSVPELKGEVARPMSITVNYLNEKGEDITMDAEELLARAICHEVDHLNGILFKDRVKNTQVK